MEQQRSQMVTELNKLVSNTLILNGGVTLSSLGSLRVVAESPKAGSEKRAVRSVEYTKDEIFVSLESLICEKGRCTEAQAATVYAKWLEAVAVDGGVKIDGVGRLSAGRFMCDNRLLAKLNPTESVAPKRSGKRGLWITLAAVVAAVAVALGVYLYIDGSQSTQQEVVTPAAKPTEDMEIDPEMMVTPEAEVVTPAAKPTEEMELDPEMMVTPEVAKETPKEESVKGLLGDALRAGAASSAKPFRVICGVFSTEQYANKTIREVQEKLGRNHQCTAYTEGDKYFLSIYDASSQREALNYAKQKQKLFKERLWVSQNRVK